MLQKLIFYLFSVYLSLFTLKMYRNIVMFHFLTLFKLRFLLSSQFFQIKNPVSVLVPNISKISVLEPGLFDSVPVPVRGLEIELT